MDLLMADEITSGELDRRMTDMGRRMDAGFSRLERTIGQLSYVRKDLHASQMDEVFKRLSALEAKDAWRLRTLLVSVAMPILVGIIILLLQSKP